MSLWEKSTAFAANRGLESCRNWNCSLCFELGALVKLMWQKLFANQPVAVAHHNRAAAHARVFPNQLELVKASKFVVITGALTSAGGLPFRFDTLHHSYLWCPTLVAVFWRQGGHHLHSEC